MRRIILRSTMNAGGATMKLKNDMIGSWTTITASRPISESRSRPIAVTSRLMTWLAAAAPVVSRAMNSEECRSEKNATFWLISALNICRWFSATMRLPICASITD